MCLIHLDSGVGVPQVVAAIARRSIARETSATGFARNNSFQMVAVEGFCQGLLSQVSGI